MSELDTHSRGKKGSTLMKKVKSTNYQITKAVPVTIHSTISVKIDNDFKEIKATEIPIMDFHSTGSTLTKKTIDDVFVVTTLVEIKIDENEEVIRPVQTTEIVEENGPEEMTIDDFIEDFKL